MMGLVVVLIGAALWWWSVVSTVRAYPGERMPMFAIPQKAPRRAVAARALGAAATVFGVATIGWGAAPVPSWAVGPLAGGLAALVLLAPWVLAVAAHNRRIESEPRALDG